MNASRQFKTCSRCDLVKTALQFHYKYQNADGLASHCIPCERALQDERREARKAAEAIPCPIAAALNGWAAPLRRAEPRISCGASCEVWTL
jgi:hypothetical protein